MKVTELTKEMQQLLRERSNKPLIIGGPDCICHPGMRHPPKDRKRTTMLAELEETMRKNGVTIDQDPGDEDSK